MNKMDSLYFSCGDDGLYFYEFASRTEMVNWYDRLRFSGKVKCQDDDSLFEKPKHCLKIMINLKWRNIELHTNDHDNIIKIKLKNF